MSEREIWTEAVPCGNPALHLKHHSALFKNRFLIHLYLLRVSWWLFFRFDCPLNAHAPSHRMCIIFLFPLYYQFVENMFLYILFDYYVLFIFDPSLELHTAQFSLYSLLHVYTLLTCDKTLLPQRHRNTY